MTSYRPTRKMQAVTLAGACATLAAWALRAFGGVEVPAGVEAAITTVCAAALGYLIPEVSRETDQS